MTHIAVVARSRSTVRALLSASREAGYDAEAPKEPIAWSQRPGPRATISVLRDAVDWEMLPALAAASPTHRVLAVLEGEFANRDLEALKLGAHGVADGDREPEEIVAELAHVLEGRPRIPYPTLRRAVAHAPITPPDIPPEEVEVFGYFVEGLTIEEIALRRVDSKSKTERMLRTLLKRFHCANRYDAILQAERWGLLDNVVVGGRD